MPIEIEIDEVHKIKIDHLWVDGKLQQYPFLDPAATDNDNLRNHDGWASDECWEITTAACTCGWQFDGTRIRFGRPTWNLAGKMIHRYSSPQAAVLFEARRHLHPVLRALADREVEFTTYEMSSHEGRKEWGCATGEFDDGDLRVSPNCSFVVPAGCTYYRTRGVHICPWCAIENQEVRSTGNSWRHLRRTGAPVEHL